MVSSIVATAELGWQVVLCCESCRTAFWAKSANAASNHIGAEKTLAKRTTSRSRSKGTQTRACRTWTRCCTPKPDSPRARSSTTTCASRRCCCRTCKDRPLTLKRYPERRRRHVLLREELPDASPRMGEDGAGVERGQQRTHATTAWRTICRRWSGRRTWPTSSCTPRCRWPRTSMQPDHHGVRPRSRAAREHRAVLPGGAVAARHLRASGWRVSPRRRARRDCRSTCR